jgi:DNA-binding beta-propeller fold protein YncE
MWHRIFVLTLATFMMAPLTSSKADSPSWLLVAEKGGQSLGIVDASTGKYLASVPENGITGHEVIASSDGKLAYVPIYGNSGVGQPGTDGSQLVVIDIAARKITGTVDFGHGVRPHCPLVGPKDGLLYVTTELDHSVTLIDPKTLKIAGSIPTGQPESHMLALSHDGKRGYTANVGPGTVSVLDIPGRKTVTVISVSPHIQRISISLDDNLVFTADQTKPQLAVIETATNKVKTWIPLAATGYGTAPTLDGKSLLVAEPGANQVQVIDLASMTVTHSISVPPTPQEVLVRPDGKAAYVSCDHSNQVAEIDLASWKVSRVIDTGKGADGLAWAGK